MQNFGVKSKAIGNLVKKTSTIVSVQGPISAKPVKLDQSDGKFLKHPKMITGPGLRTILAVAKPKGVSSIGKLC